MEDTFVLQALVKAQPIVKRGRLEGDVRVLAEPTSDGIQATCIAVSNDDSELALGCSDGAIRLWNTKGTVQIAVIDLEAGPIASVSFARDRDRVIASSLGGRVCVWSRSLGEIIESYELDSPVLSVVYDNAGERVIATPFDSRDLWVATLRQKSRAESGE